MIGEIWGPRFRFITLLRKQLQNILWMGSRCETGFEVKSYWSYLEKVIDVIEKDFLVCWLIRDKIFIGFTTDELGWIKDARYSIQSIHYWCFVCSVKIQDLIVYLCLWWGCFSSFTLVRCRPKLCSIGEEICRSGTSTAQAMQIRTLSCK